MNFHYIVAVMVICLLAAVTLLFDAAAAQDELEITTLQENFIANFCAEMRLEKYFGRDGIFNMNGLVVRSVI